MATRVSKRDKLINAALALAAERPWVEIGMGHVAREAGVSLADARAEFRSLDGIVLAFFDRIDTEMLKDVGPPVPDESVRDRVFDITMRRFDALAPHKESVRRLAGALAFEPGLAMASFLRLIQSQIWILDAAGGRTHGVEGLLKAKGMATLYARTFRVWLDEDDPGMPRTMATLDRGLRRGERWARRLDRPLGLLRDFEAMASTLASARRIRREQSEGNGRAANGALGEA